MKTETWTVGRLHPGMHIVKGDGEIAEIVGIETTNNPNVQLFSLHNKDGSFSQLNLSVNSKIEVLDY